MLLLEVFFFSMLFVSTTACWILCLTIIKYLTSKPLGKQTLLDKFIIEFIKAYIIKTTSGNCLAHFMVFPYKLPELLARLAFYVNNFFTDNVIIWFIILMTVKYVLIYRPCMVDLQKTDEEMIKIARCVVIITVLIPYSLEHLVIRNLKGSSTYVLLTEETGNENAGLPITTQIEAKVALMLLAFIQLKIERDRIYHNETLPFRQKLGKFFCIDEEQPGEEFSKNTSRALAVGAIALIVILFILNQSSWLETTIADVEGISTQRILMGIFASSLAPNLPPLMYILNHKNIVKYVKRAIIDQ